LLDGLLKTKGG